ncbi:Cerato-ulmin hydrophobin family [Microdochium trichocladiopsis]|uniref:Cerato-ulmin hydrophobin family n=1 Tax=Microdochium trichocladiopsis TaxID=1682393 RepID=A0A9P8Y9Z4_9PEZI|nr:Cerato-ulmin hydrophobin family [Microdochium trichocladiopsis]KAH7031484.1 Cerato-ulmin hydrophobin family [Microdochium trichocladiopsis]
MKTSFAIASILLAASSVLAAPTDARPPKYTPLPSPSGGSYDPCSGLYDSAQCCATDVLGVADLDCDTPPKALTSAKQFGETCAKIGQRARCCVLPVLGQAVLCQTPAGL